MSGIVVLVIRAIAITRSLCLSGNSPVYHLAGPADAIGIGQSCPDSDFDDYTYYQVISIRLEFNIPEVIIGRDPAL